MAPATVFIDELDGIGQSRTSGGSFGANDEREQTLDQILTEMDGFTGTEGVIVLGATNRPDVLDPALLRPGRFDRRVLVNPPDLSGRAAIRRVHTRGVPLAHGIDLTARPVASQPRAARQPRAHPAGPRDPRRGRRLPRGGVPGPDLADTEP